MYITRLRLYVIERSRSRVDLWQRLTTGEWDWRWFSAHCWSNRGVRVGFEVGLSSEFVFISIHLVRRWLYLQWERGYNV